MQTIAIAATFTAEPILEVVELWIHELDLEARVALSPGGQVIQALLDPASPLAQNRSGLGVALVRLEDWGGTGAADLVGALRLAASRSSVPLLLCFCPPSPAAQSSGRAAAFEQAEARVAAELAGEGGVEVIRSSELAVLYPVAEPHDPVSDALGQIPYTPAQFAALGTLVARRLHALGSPPYKVIAVDCDETLWGGVAGEDGPAGVILDGPRRELQELLVAHHDAGMLLCLCSRNEDADVAAVLAARPEMPLGLRHIALRRVGWGRKSEALRSLVAELGLGLDSVVFLDDSPVERAEVRVSCPEVLTPELPGDPVRVPGFLRGLWALDRRRPTAEDGRRPELRRQEERRVQGRRASRSLEEFLAGLELEVGFVPLSAATAARAAQLTQRTNQLNVTTRRRTEAELLALTREGALEGLVVDVRDRFGDYGTVGLLLFATGPEALEVDTLLLSCRALGRGVEERMLAHLGRVAEERGRARVDVPFVPSARNRPALDLLESADTSPPEPAGEGCIFRLPAGSLGVGRRAAGPRAQSLTMPETAKPPAHGRRAPEQRARRFERIAGSLADVGSILAAIDERRRHRASAPGPADPPVGPVEEAVAAVWREVLHVTEVRAGEAFFAAGGDSVAMVRVISRLRDAFGIEVTPGQFFAAPTVRGLGSLISGGRAGEATPHEAALPLDLIEGQRAEQVGVLLERAPARTRPVTIESIGLVTADRPGALVRSLDSYADNARRHGRALDFVVFDDSRAPDVRAKVRAALAVRAAERGIPIRYAGAEEKAAFARELAGRDLPLDVVLFALLADGHGTSTAGANRNALLLDAVGSAVFSADDDTLCRIAAAPAPEPGIGAVTGRDPCDYWFFPDRATALRAAPLVDSDLLASHEALLGHDAGSLVPGERSGPVVFTSSGLAGDCGWGAPFGWWLGPMGYLAMRGASLERLFAAREARGEPLSSRAILRVAPRPCLADESFSMTTFAGLDARAVLPPFCPIGRGQDNVFGAAVAACIPGARFGHVPEALVHAPVEERRFWPGELARTASGVDASRVLIECIRAWDPGGDGSPAGRIGALGRHLRDLGAGGAGEFEQVVRARLAVSNRALTEWLEEGLASRPPAWWVDETQRVLVAVRAASARDDYAAPLDLHGGPGSARDLVRRVGELFVHWPAMVEAARGLRARGRRLGAPVEPEKATIAAPRPDRAPIARRPPAERPALSFAQERLWLLDRFVSGVALHVVGLHFRLDGPLDAAVLGRALGEVVRRHEALRTTFDEIDGMPSPVLRLAPETVLPVVDLGPLPAAEREVEADRLAAAEARRPFDLRRDLPLRAALLRLDDRAHVLLVTVHHVAFDGWSAGILLHELSALYGAFARGLASPLPELPLQYADFAAWQRVRFTGDALRGPIAYFRERLAGAPGSLDLPADRPRPAVPSHRGGRERFALSPSLRASLEALGRAEGVTPFMVLLAGYQALLHRCSGQDSVVVGAPVAGRGRTEIEGIVGVFINTLALRADLSDDPPFRTLLGRVRAEVLAAFAHQDLPFEKLVEALDPDRRIASSPVFQAMLVVQSEPALTLEGVTATALPVDNGAVDLDLSLSLVEGAHGLAGTMRYRADLFDAATIARLLGSYRALLEAAAADPDRPVSRLAVLPAAERERLLVAWNRTEAPFPRDTCVHDLFLAQVERVPDAIAVSSGDLALTYRALAAQASRLASRLAARGAGPGARVAVLLDRSPAMIVALLGVLEAGAAYVPLDPEHPADRLAFVLADAGVSLLLTLRHLAARAPAGGALVVFDDDDDEDAKVKAGVRRAGPGDVAYVIYTSGSTGRPKGVPIAHRSVVAFLTAMAAVPGLTERDTLLAVTTLSFDIAGLEIFLPLSVGARVVLAERRDAESGARLRALLERSRATVLQATPATWRLLVDAGFDGGPGFTALSGGDTLSPVLAAELLRRAGAVYNLYGPTETTIWSTLHRLLDAAGPIPVGHPIANTRVHVLDRHLEPVPLGVAGELCIGGEGLSPGYLGRPELTAERFVPDPFAPGERLYRTGDRARRRADGAIELLGRLDFQIKLRGHRIEPGEIEARLGEHPAVHQAAVVTRAGSTVEARLTAYVVVQGEPPSAAALRAHLAAALPDAMIPAEIVVVDRLPLTANGKVDRGALAGGGPVSGPAAGGGPVFSAPGDALEAELVALWEDVLGVRPISTGDDFFALGGHSMLAARLFDRIEARTARRLPLAVLLQAPTIERLAGLLRREGWSPSWSSLVAIQPRGTAPPFFCVHAVGGNILNYRLLSGQLGEDRPVYGLQSRGLDGVAMPHASVEEMAAHYVEEIRAVRPRGPYHLGGASSGGIVAFEMARQLAARGEPVAILVLMDTYPLGPIAGRSSPAVARSPLRRFAAAADIHLGVLQRRDAAAGLAYLAERARAKLRRWADDAARARGRADAPSALEILVAQNEAALRCYTAKPYPGRVTILLTREEPHRTSDDPRLCWGELSGGGLEVHLVPGNHDTMLDPANVARVGATLHACLRRSS